MDLTIHSVTDEMLLEKRDSIKSKLESEIEAELGITGQDLRDLATLGVLSPSEMKEYEEMLRLEFLLGF
ncbi:hypothetical protein [Corynebacterium sp.]|uniref:hypothetical protein n=1 Tax=Corynebacterium sp. TaxID=1720 RepID=UPI0026DB0DDA|nr:hypothetical protein [Corynebacterium sp.]MDO5076011.1 hypothetical protein [Corynebacterium sp.]